MSKYNPNTTNDMRVQRIKNQKGVILLLTLFILSSILIVTLGAADLVLAGIKMNRQTGYSSIAFYASEAGLERALWETRKNSTFTLPDANNPSLFIMNNIGNNSSYVVNYATSTPNVTFTSTGNFRGIKRSTQTTFEAH
jgi:hypothetical protein